MRTSRKVRAMVAGLLAANGTYFAACAQVNAESKLEEIVVTASKRGAISVQELPFSIQAISGDQLSNLGATGIEDISGIVPGFTAYNAGSNQKKLRIRGISSSSESEPQETVGVYLDNIPITGAGGTNNENGASPDINLFDLNRVEVIKGPSGTIYGAGSMGGTIRYILNEPDTEAFRADLELAASTTKDGEASYGGNLMLNMPLTDSLAFRAVAGIREVGGYIDNIVQTGVSTAPKKGPEEDINSDKITSGIFSIKWDPSERLSLLGRYVLNDYDVDGEGSIDADARVKLDPVYTPPTENLEQVRFIEEVNRDELELFSIDLEYAFDSMTLASSTGYTERTTFDRQDTSVVAVLFFGASPGQIGGPTQIAAPLENDTYYDQFTQEFRLSSNNAGSLSWLVGAYYFDLDKEFSQGGTVAGLDDWIGGLTGLFGRPDVPFESLTTQNLEQIAVYGEATWEFSEDWIVTVGARWFEIEQDFLQVANGLINGGPSRQEGDASESDVNPRFSISHQASESTLFYATASKGYRVGGINQPVPLDAGTGCRDELEGLGLSAAPGSFSSDSLWSYELGSKLEFADNRARLNAAIYYVDWSDIQARKQLACGFTFYANSAEAEVYGAELDFRYQVTDSLLLAGTVGYNDASLSKDDAFFNAPKGSDVPGVSELTYSVTARYDFTLFSMQSYLAADYRYMSEFDSVFVSNDPANRTSGGFGILNLRAGMDISEQVAVGLFVRNATDELEISGTQSNLFGDYAFVTRPREIGVRLNVSF
jgi:iron complex outermembrane receptor protein